MVGEIQTLVAVVWGWEGPWATLTAASGVKPEELGQTTLLHHGCAAQVLLVENLEEVFQLCQ